MSAAITAGLGIAFLGLALASVLLMFQFWGYPFDEAKRRSHCPQWKMNIHRGVGYAYLVVYLIMMSQMVPRLWTYQVEFPARTVAHIMLAITIGVILLLKILILRWFRHFEEWMPVLGVSLLLCTFLLVGLSVPNVLKERAWANRTEGGAMSSSNRTRVARLLTQAGLPEGGTRAAEEITSIKNLEAGREVLLSKCTHCHDLKTAIERPRTAADWHRTVQRMADKPSLGSAISPREINQTTAYLVAITPGLKESAVAKRQADQMKVETMSTMAKASDARASGADAGPGDAAPATAPVDPARAEAAYKEVCSQCHELSDVDKSPPKSEADVDTLMTRMVENGLEAKPEEIALARFHLLAAYVRKK